MTDIWSEELRYNYPLNKDSIVLDIGGFEGLWAYTIYSKYRCFIHVYEPVKAFYDILSSKLAGIDKVKTYNYGLGVKDELVNIRIAGSSTSVLNKSETGEQAEIRDILPILRGLDKVDLVKINIEGAEYDLIDYIIEKGLQTKLVNIQIQFHMNIENYEERRNYIRGELSKTHHLTYDYPYTHENWKLNNS